MARLLPIQRETELPDSGPRVVDLEGEDADAVFSALSSDTARNIYRTLQEEPHTPSEIAEAADTSIQNVRYHLDNLEEAGLIEVVDTWYSSRGNEMSVYAPSSDALVLASGEEQTSRLRTALSRIVSGVIVLALASLAFQQAAKEWLGGQVGLGASGGGDGDAESYAMTDGGDGGDAGAAGGDGGDGGDGGAGGGAGDDGGNLAGERLDGTNKSETTTVSEEAATTESDGPGIFDADTTTASPSDTATATREATETATPAGSATPTQPAGTTQPPQGTPTPEATPTPSATQTATPPPTPTETPAPTGTVEPETTRTAVEVTNATVGDAVRETTTTMASEPTITTTAADGARTANEAIVAGGLPPGLIFFLGGAVVLVSIVAYLYWTGA